MIIGGREFKRSGHTYVMGILNVTPDSFSDGGQHNSIDAALSHAQKMINEGADIIDVGGESTRPGYGAVTDEVEIERVVPVIEKIKSNFDIPVSIDTYKSVVAAAAIDAGADLVNDIWGLKGDEKMGELIAKSNAACCLMHNRREPVQPPFKLLPEVKTDMEDILLLAKNAGIADDKIILDPGIGFGKTYEHNLAVLAHKNFMMPEGFPVLLGTSRKSVIGLTLDTDVSERVEGTIVTTVMAVLAGAMFVRVHDIKENVRAIKMAEAIKWSR